MQLNLDAYEMVSIPAIVLVKLCIIEDAIHVKCGPHHWWFFYRKSGNKDQNGDAN